MPPQTVSTFSVFECLIFRNERAVLLMAHACAMLIDALRV
jgi:hypothetical protein